jgi:DNA invertase Pin-like site-specific DNA recombinase
MRPGRPQICDVVAVWSVDRLGRSLQHLVGFLEELDAAGCDLYLHQQALDTTTPAGRAMFQMLGVFSEFERSIIRSRVKAGMARARIHGTKSGNPIGQQPLPKHKVAMIRAELQKGTGIIKTAVVRNRRLGGAAHQARDGGLTRLIVANAPHHPPGRPGGNGCRRDAHPSAASCAGRACPAHKRRTSLCRP